MLFKDYVAGAVKTMNTHNTCEDRIVNSALGIADEIFELHRGIDKWATTGNRKDKDNIIEELGDLLWYLVNYSYWYGLRVTEAFMVPLELSAGLYVSSKSTNIKEILQDLAANCATCISITKKVFYQGHQSDTASDAALSAAIYRAIVDVYVLSTAFDRDIHTVCVRNLAKLEERYGKAFSPEGSIGRDYDAERRAADDAAAASSPASS